jgi:hypothetical protein
MFITLHENQQQYIKKPFPCDRIENKFSIVTKKESNKEQFVSEFWLTKHRSRCEPLDAIHT